MTPAQLSALIVQELWVDEARVTGQFRHKKNAEFLERLLYVCPRCGLSTFESHDDLVTCRKCNLKVRHLPTKELEGVDCEIPYRFVADWYDAQCDFVNRLDLLSLTETPVYEETVSFRRVNVYKNKELLAKEAKVRL